MIGSRFTYRFSGKPIKRAVDPVKRKALYRMSAFVRTAMRSSIKTRKKAKPAPAGKPPFSRSSRKPNLRTIVFAVDLRDESAVIGPIEFRGRATKEPAPKLLEHGGTSSQKIGGQRRRIKVRPHPFAQPALEQELPKFPELLRG